MGPTHAGATDPGARSMPGERQLVAAIERIIRSPEGWSVVAVHLSRLPGPGPRPYHRRVAGAVMREAALRVEGQIFALRNGDVMLLCRETAASAGIPAILRRMFGGEAGDPEAVVSEWRLPHAGAALLAYAAARIAELEGPDADEGTAPPPAVAATVAAAIARTRSYDLVRQQLAVLLEPAASGAGVTMRPLYRELTLSLEVLEARLEAPLRLGHDIALLLHLGRLFDQRMLAFLRLDRGTGTPLDIDAGSGPGTAGDIPLPLHLNLSLPGLLSEDFTALATACRTAGRPLVAEVALVEALGDPAAYWVGRARSRDAGVRLVLDGVSHDALLLARPAALQADLIKLEWSPGIPELRPDDQSALADAVVEADPARLIVQRADSELAIQWGLALGLRRFQGRHVDRMLAARRMLVCDGAPACTLRQCAERVRETGGPRRSACTNLRLLDAGMPPARAAAAG